MKAGRSPEQGRSRPHPNLFMDFLLECIDPRSKRSNPIGFIGRIQKFLLSPIQMGGECKRISSDFGKRVDLKNKSEG
jgi:hypothetical protein